MTRQTIIAAIIGLGAALPAQANSTLMAERLGLPANTYTLGEVVQIYMESGKTARDQRRAIIDRNRAEFNAEVWDAMQRNGGSDTTRSTRAE